MSSETEQTEWLTTSEAAEIMGIKRDTVAEYCRRGTLTCRRFGRDWQVWRQDAENHKRSTRGRPRKDG